MESRFQIPLLLSCIKPAFRLGFQPFLSSDKSPAFFLYKEGTVIIIYIRFSIFLTKFVFSIFFQIFELNFSAILLSESPIRIHLSCTRAKLRTQNLPFWIRNLSHIATHLVHCCGWGESAIHFKKPIYGSVVSNRTGKSG